MTAEHDILEADVPLCVDLDGTLIRTDMLWESTVLLLLRKPWCAFALPAWMLKGRAALKRSIQQRVTVPVDSLPYNAELISWLRAEKHKGRNLVLATASDSLAVEPLARHLGLFDLVLSSDGVRNLKGTDKLAELEARFGKSFDYVGNSSADLPIWRECRQAIVVNASASVAKAAERAGNVARTFDSRRPVIPLLLREMRLYQWVKNLLVFIPLLTSHKITNIHLLGQAAAAFLAFGLIASSVYVLNDVFDLQSDRNHPRKRKRPFASGDLALPRAFLLGPGLLLAGFGLAAWLVPSSLGVLLAYYVLTCLYSYSLKTKLLLDVFALAGLYTIRIVMGSAACHVELSVWLLSFSMFSFLSLGFAKRSAELYNMAKEGNPRNSRRAYMASDLPQVNIFGVASGFAASLVLTLYMNSENVRLLYRNPNLLWLLFPLMLYWVSRIWILTSRGEMDEDPVLFAAKDRITILVLLSFILVMLLATREWPSTL